MFILHAVIRVWYCENKCTKGFADQPSLEKLHTVPVKDKYIKTQRNAESHYQDYIVSNGEVYTTNTGNLYGHWIHKWTPSCKKW